MKNYVLFIISLCATTTVFSQSEYEWQGKFEQLGQELPTPNVYRSADGSPGPMYWQQKADYNIKVKLDEDKRRISGSEVVTYFNQSPHVLNYLWLQLEQNVRRADSDQALSKNYGLKDSVPGKMFMYHFNLRSRTCGMNITSVKTEEGKSLDYVINGTMMRVDLPVPLVPGQSFSFNVSWWYDLNNRMEEFGRSGYENFPDDGNDVFTIAQFYPRLAVYDDYEGWQHKQFMGGGEFALTFGDFNVEITVPSDHILLATGEIQNAKDVLSRDQYKRFNKSLQSFDEPVIIANEEEARRRESERLTTEKTWHFKAENVRDFAFATSRKFIWDAQAVQLGDKKVMAMSLYPKEGNPLWQKESTKAVINTLKTYSKYTLDYPYPVATSVHAASIGMEYPMICFNFGRPHKDGTYTDATRFGMIGVIIHEVGHNFFPMIVNSDERQWTWMDEGLNSFLEYRTQKECYVNYPYDKGPPQTIIPYMTGNKKYIRPIMTNSEQVIQLGPNAYAKPAAALNILRETVLGPELFDKAFKTYATRWAFKHPKPADFFRTMEDASGVDLDWFWRGWFYSIDHVDISIDTVIWYKHDPQRSINLAGLPHSGEDIDWPQADTFKISSTPPAYYGEFLERIDHDSLISEFEDKFFYEVKLENEGGLIMPIILEFEFTDNSRQRLKLPAETWRQLEHKASKVFYFDKMVKKIVLDPDGETADAVVGNNVFPREGE